ncbi:MAG: hypothetical protein J2P54_18920, partial [Bradyrhizobiaceae bacterium]|nr:hypothetical protein [Bradyrhizobiaceae bacterium]
AVRCQFVAVRGLTAMVSLITASKGLLNRSTRWLLVSAARAAQLPRTFAPQEIRPQFTALARLLLPTRRAPEDYSGLGQIGMRAQMPVRWPFLYSPIAPRGS